MKIAICENNPSDIQTLTRLLYTCAQKRNEQFEIDEYTSAEALLKSPIRFYYTIIFFDVCMDGINGIEVARELSKYTSFHIVFYTSSMDFAFSAIQMNAVHYLLKPVSADDIEIVLNRCKQRILHDISVLKITVNKQMLEIPQTSIQYIEKFDKVACVHTDTAEFKTYTTLSDIETQLDPQLYLRPQRSYLINMSYIHEMDAKKIILKNMVTIFMSRKSALSLRQHYYNFLFQQTRS